MGMRSSIFSFDVSDLVKAAAAATAVILVAWISVPSELPSDNQAPISAEVANELVVQRYISEYHDKPVVVVGSSIAAMLPSPDCSPDNVTTIPVQGRGGLTGLEIIRRIGTGDVPVDVEIGGQALLTLSQ
jgi:hypothetical protein